MSASYIILFVILILLDIVVYGFGSAMHAQRREDPEEPPGDEPNTLAARRKALVRKILEDQSDYVDTVQTVTAMINAAYGAFYGTRIARILYAQVLRGDNYTQAGSMACLVLSYIIAWILMFYVIEVIGVQIPKRLAAHDPERWVMSCGRVFRLILVILLPLVRLISTTATGILYVMGVRGEHLSGAVSEEEIISIVNEGHEQGVLDQSETEMITNIFEFNDKEAGEIMTHRGEILAIDAATTLQQAITFMLDARNSRFPIYVSNIDNVMGVVHLRDAVKYKEEHPEAADNPIGEIRDVIRDPIFVPETKNIDDLFRQMQEQKAQVVLVIDEYGQTSGLIAMEDILEEIVGNILDEYDIDEQHITPTGSKNEFLVEGRTPLEELEDRFGMEFQDDRFETINGYIMSQMDRVPQPNDHFVCEHDGYRFRVLSVEDRQVQRVLLTKLVN